MCSSCVSVSSPSFHSNPSSNFPSLLPPLLSLSSISSKEAVQGYLESFGEFRGIDFTSTSRSSSSKTFKVIKVRNLNT